MISELSVGTVRRMAGYCTQAFFLRGKTLAELEGLLGFRKGRLSRGATIAFLKHLPGPDDFQLAGYTYFSDGAVGGHKLSFADRAPFRMESLLRTEHGMSAEQIQNIKKKMLGTKMRVTGYERLAKLIPIAPHTASEEYPPGQGIFQVNITRPLPFEVKAIILPGEKWMGDYH